MLNIDKSSYVIAEVAQAHDGSLGNAYAFAKLAKQCGADAVKFQMHFADVESGPEETWRVNFSYQDNTRYDYWKRIEFTPENWFNLKGYCDELGIDFICSAFSQTAAELLINMGVSTFKVASGEVDNYLFLDFLRCNAKEVILSTGMSDIYEIKSSYDRLKDSVSTSILQCTTNYPSPLTEMGLNNINKISAVCGTKRVGLSDHSGMITPAIYAHALGARIFEHHICFHKSQFGPDTSSSLNPKEFMALTKSLKDCDILSANPVEKSKTEHAENRQRFGKSLVFKNALSVGHVLTVDDLETRKPAGFGIHPSDYEFLVGQRLAVDVEQGDFVTKTVLEIE